MKNKALLIATALVLLMLTLVLTACAAGPRTIDSPGLWSLEKMGYSDLVFPNKKPLEETAIKYILPANAAQGPESWYAIYLHFSIEFSDDSDNGTAYVSAATDGRTAAQIKFMTTKKPDGSLTIDWRSEERRVGKECRSRWSPYH